VEGVGVGPTGEASNRRHDETRIIKRSAEKKLETKEKIESSAHTCPREEPSMMGKGVNEKTS